MSDISTNQLIEDFVSARENKQVVARPTDHIPNFDIPAAYKIAAEMDRFYLSKGWVRRGRKLGFTNSATWDEFDLSGPTWAYVYEQTVEDLKNGVGTTDISAYALPRIEPEIVLGVNEKISELSDRGDVSTTELAQMVDWIAPAFEVVDCHFNEWQFNAANIIVDFGAHAALHVGEKVYLDDDSRHNLSEQLGAVKVELVCGGESVDSGVGANVLGSPLIVLQNLVSMLHEQAWGDPLVGGELITTGTLTQIPFIKSGETWSARYSGCGLGELSLDIS